MNGTRNPGYEQIHVRVRAKVRVADVSRRVSTNRHVVTRKVVVYAGDATNALTQICIMHDANESCFATPLELQRER